MLDITIYCIGIDTQAVATGLCFTNVGGTCLTEDDPEVTTHSKKKMALITLF